MAKNRKVNSGPATPVVLYNESTGQPQAVDGDSSGGIVTIDSPHRKIHQGLAFQAYNKVAHDSPLADDASINIHLSTEKEIHVEIAIHAGGDMEVEIIEEPATVTPGTPFTPRNLKRASDNLSNTTVTTNASNITGGFMLANYFIPGGSGPQAAGGIARSSSEREFKTGTSYIIRVYNRSGATQLVSMIVEWYEED